MVAPRFSAKTENRGAFCAFGPMQLSRALWLQGKLLFFACCFTVEDPVFVIAEFQGDQLFQGGYMVSGLWAQWPVSR